ELGRERDRAAGGGGAERAVVAFVAERRATREISVELAAVAAEREGLICGAVARSEAPDVAAVSQPAAPIGDRVRALREGRSARVLEVVDTAAAHVCVLNLPKIDPDVRVLVTEQGRELDERLAVIGAPLIPTHPLAPGRCVGRMRRRAEGEDVEDHALVVADPARGDESRLRMPAHAYGR